MKKFVIIFLLLIPLLFVFADEQIETEESKPVITILTIDSAIGPITVREISNGIKRSKALNAEVFIIELNTPGGNIESTWDIIEKILASDIPIVVYVSPSGGRAASAGVFISYAAHIAAMAPQTNIGSAHPVAMGGTEMDSTMSGKITNDAVAQIKTLANKRKRNIEWAEESVRESVSITEYEASEKNVINYVAKDIEDLLFQMHQDTVEVVTGSYVIDTENAETIRLNIGYTNKILEVITDPNIAYILMMIGMLGIYFEFSNPGAVLPGVIGGISLILALFSFQALPINFAGVLFLLLAIVLFLLEVKIASNGILGGGGVISLILGSMMLVNDSQWPYKGISLSVIIPTAIVFSLFFFLAAYFALKAHKMKISTGESGLVGEIGTAKTVIGPNGGSIFIHGEYWNAVADVEIEPSMRIVVVDVKGMEVKVKKVEN